MTDQLTVPDGIQEPLKPYRTILSLEIQQAVEELRRPAHGLFISGLTAGFSIGIGPFLAALFLSQPTTLISSPVAVLLAAVVYPFGFIVVILGRMDLFTEYTTISVLPAFTGQSTSAPIARLWGLTYLGNMAGVFLFVVLMLILSPSLDADLIDGVVLVSARLIDHRWWTIILSAFFTGWLMGLLSWLIAASRDTISQIFFVWAITFGFSLGHLHHSVSGTVSVLWSVLAVAEFSAADLVHFLVWTTLGNAAGGITFAAAIRYSLRMHPEHEEQQAPGAESKSRRSR